MMSSSFPSLKLIEVSDEEISKDYFPWFLMNEFLFKSYLIRHPEHISENLEFIGYEIYGIDLIFRKNDNLYIVEAKCIKADIMKPFGMTEPFNTKIKSAMSQLMRYIEKIKLKYSEELLVPVLAVCIKKGDVDFKLHDLNHLWEKVCNEELRKEKHVKLLDHKIQVAKKKVHLLNKKVGEQLTDLRKIKNGKALPFNKEPSKHKYPVGKVYEENKRIMDRLLKGEI